MLLFVGLLLWQSSTTDGVLVVVVEAVNIPILLLAVSWWRWVW